MIETASDTEIVSAFMQDVASFMAELPDQIEPTIDHHFYPGLYIRTMYVPAGSQLLSKIHKTEHAFKLEKGRILIYDGVSAVILEAPYTGRTMPGGQRIGIALEDVVWSNLHPTKVVPRNNSTEAKIEAVKKIENRLVVPFKKLKLKKQEV